MPSELPPIVSLKRMSALDALLCGGFLSRKILVLQGLGPHMNSICLVLLAERAVLNN